MSKISDMAGKHIEITMIVPTTRAECEEIECDTCVYNDRVGLVQCKQVYDFAD